MSTPANIVISVIVFVITWHIRRRIFVDRDERRWRSQVTMMISLKLPAGHLCATSLPRLYQSPHAELPLQHLVSPRLVGLTVPVILVERTNGEQEWDAILLEKIQVR